MSLENRSEHRSAAQLRTVRITRQFTKHAEGSVLVEFGDTKVLCTASIEDRVPGFLKGQGQGWLTAEYGMLPRSTHSRMDREAAKGKQSGRTQEIQRLIGRSLRAAVDLKALGERTLHLDCDVLQADGGTRTAAITGAFVAVVDALKTLQAKGVTFPGTAVDLTWGLPIVDFVAAVSVGVVNGQARLDLDYVEDSGCDSDLNVVMTGSGGLIEVQGTAEGAAFSRGELNTLLDLAQSGIQQLIEQQKKALQWPVR